MIFNSELANQKARKVIFTCAVFANHSSLYLFQIGLDVESVEIRRPLSYS